MKKIVLKCCAELRQEIHTRYWSHQFIPDDYTRDRQSDQHGTSANIPAVLNKLLVNLTILQKDQVSVTSCATTFT